jgi:putative nucleotidyltransferase with HDIG domain
MKIGYLKLTDINLNIIKNHFTNYQLVNINTNIYTICDVILLDEDDTLTTEQKTFFVMLNIPIISYANLKDHNNIINDNHYLDKYLKLNTFIEEDEKSLGHSLRVASYANSLARTLHLSDTDIKNIYLAALFHDIGKILVPAKIVYKPSKLNNEEYGLMKEHTLKGKLITANFLNDTTSNIIKYHHEKEDGSGYPDGLTSTIPIGSKIIAIADSYDAMTSSRIYNSPLTKEEAINELVACSTAVASGGKGLKYDQQLINNFIEILEN